MKTQIHIDTSNSHSTKVFLTIDGKEKKAIKLNESGHSQTVLPLLSELFTKEQVNFSTVTEITVYAGPGSFTGVRIGVAIANTLAWALNVPVNGKKTVTPVYSTSKFD